MENRMGKKKINRVQKNGKTNLSLSLLFIAITFLLILSIPLSIQATQSDDNTNISQLEQYLGNSTYSDFQKRMVLNTAQEAINDGISAEDTLSIIKNSIDNEVAPYNIKKFIDTAISAKNDGIAEKPILNKIKEGLAKKVDERLIINAINQKSENMRIARDLLSENHIQNGESEEMIDVLAESLANGVSENVLSQILKISSEQDKSWQEVEEVTQELANLGLRAIELGIGNDKIETIFIQALDADNSLENICFNIQDLMLSAIAAQVSSSTVSKDAGIDGGSGSSAPALSSTSSGSTLPGSSPSAPSGETGSSPISSSGGSNKTDSESGSSPLN
ncbi:MAG: hypothetical protein RBT05_11055 [Bacteroidales bacterium]|jgi:hypothetical protein|nr:hypothetical protein [Bacteroidales bacterium]